MGKKEDSVFGKGTARERGLGPDHWDPEDWVEFEKEQDAANTFKQAKHSKKITLMCKGDVCVDEDGNLSIDLRKTDCDAEKAKKFLEPLMAGREVVWKMPKIIAKEEEKKKTKV